MNVGVGSAKKNEGSKRKALVSAFNKESKAGSCRGEPEGEGVVKIPNQSTICYC